MAVQVWPCEINSVRNESVQPSSEIVYQIADLLVQSMSNTKQLENTDVTHAAFHARYESPM